MRHYQKLHRREPCKSVLKEQTHLLQAIQKHRFHGVLKIRLVKFIMAKNGERDFYSEHDINMARCKRKLIHLANTIVHIGGSSERGNREGRGYKRGEDWLFDLYFQSITRRSSIGGSDGICCQELLI